MTNSICHFCVPEKSQKIITFNKIMKQNKYNGKITKEIARKNE